MSAEIRNTLIIDFEDIKHSSYYECIYQHVIESGLKGFLKGSDLILVEEVCEFYNNGHVLDDGSIRTIIDEIASPAQEGNIEEQEPSVSAGGKTAPEGPTPINKGKGILFEETTETGTGTLQIDPQTEAITGDEFPYTIEQENELFEEFIQDMNKGASDALAPYIRFKEIIISMKPMRGKYAFWEFFFQFMFHSCVFAQSIKFPSPVESIYALGNAFSDTGNIIRLNPNALSARLPYGQTIGKATGRLSDGLLIIDYIAKALQLPLTPPSLDTTASFDKGASFAVDGGTALNNSFFAERGIQLIVPQTIPLHQQLEWFETNLNNICATKETDCVKNRLQKSVIFVSVMGDDDFNNAFVSGKSISEVRTYVPLIIRSIIDVVKEIIELGGKRVVVPGNIPIGCRPAYLTLFSNGTNNTNGYDLFGCLRSFNVLVELYNQDLQTALISLQQEFPQATILYADFYNAFRSLLLGAPLLGFKRETLVKACCGMGGKYNFDLNRMCGSIGTTVCPNPSTYISWDGVHLTQEAYRRISQIIIPNLLLNL
ncbi:acetylajmalan esterase-like [Impatiens glandulifera]|uniref:acetylajmalan esterase-like n=1 Tax=Impatiens glandulifera TaxID=253017 RepID=UPI001FB14C05|nr:acetylajmalan esterase-like [Impatiens glandulifera]